MRVYVRRPVLRDKMWQLARWWTVKGHAADVSGLLQLVGVGDVLGAATAAGGSTSKAIGWGGCKRSMAGRGTLLENHSQGGLTRRPIGSWISLEINVLGLQ